MKTTARVVSFLALAGTIMPAILFVADRITLDQTKLWMLVATVVWFASAPLWMDRQSGNGSGGTP
jgi:hypothetical protein